jgi:hypothetical protein
MKESRKRSARSPRYIETWENFPYSFAVPMCRCKANYKGCCVCEKDFTPGPYALGATTFSNLRLDRSTEQGFLFLDRLKLVRKAFLASFAGSLSAALICIALFLLTGCASMPELAVDEKDGSLCICVEGQCHKARVEMTRPKACLLK